MSHFDNERHPRAENIPLTQQNEIMRQQLIQGVVGILTSDFAHTYEVTDTSERRGIFALPHSKYLARTAFMKLDADSFCLDFEDMDNTRIDDAPFFQVVVTVEGHQLDIEKAEKCSPDDAEELDFVWPDSVALTILDNPLSNISTWSSCWQPTEEFEFSCIETGFTRGETDPRDTVIHQALGMEKRDGLNGPGITPGGFDHLDDLRAINKVLSTGSLDLETTAKFIDVVQDSPSAEIATSSPIVIRNSLPYLKNIIEKALFSPNIRNMIAWRQYWEQGGPGLSRQNTL